MADTAVKALDEILRVIDGHNRGEPFGTEDMSLPLLPYIEDVARRASEKESGYRDALRAVWGDMRSMDKHHVPSDVLALVRAAIGSELDRRDPAASPQPECPACRRSALREQNP